MNLYDLVLLILLSGVVSAPIGDVEEDISLLNFSDQELEEEMRKRWIGGPWSADETVSLLNTALDQLRTSSQSQRTRKFQSEARYLNQLITGIDDASVDDSGTTKEESDDLDFYDDPVYVGEGHVVSSKTMSKIIDMVDGTNGQAKRKHESIQKLYPWYQIYMLSRFRRRVANNGTRRDKFRALDRAMLKKFTEARDKRQPVHGRMIQRWAKIYAAQNGIDDFVASYHWLRNFIKHNNIVSRKVTVYTGRSETENQERTAANIEEFARRYSRESKIFPMDRIWNFDQTGFNYEPSNLRTLSFKGERDTSLQLDNKNKFTHSYTVMPMISRSGRLFPKLLIATSEGKEEFGPIVGRTVRDLELKYGNIEVFASISGKLNSQLMERWYEGTLRETVRQVSNFRQDGDELGACVLADSWSGHSTKKKSLDMKEIGVQMLRIPPQTTDRLQPLDVNFNRQLKILYNRIHEEAFYEGIAAEITSRDGILNVQSLMHNQLSSPDYRDMILYAWRHTDPDFNASTLRNNPPKMVAAIQFDFDVTEKCSTQNCDKHPFIKCAHCGKLKCLHHFLDRSCFHDPRLDSTRSKREASLPPAKPKTIRKCHFEWWGCAGGQVCEDVPIVESSTTAEVTKTENVTTEFTSTTSTETYTEITSATTTELPFTVLGITYESFDNESEAAAAMEKKKLENLSTEGAVASHSSQVETVLNQATGLLGQANEFISSAQSLRENISPSRPPAGDDSAQLARSSEENRRRSGRREQESRQRSDRIQPEQTNRPLQQRVTSPKPKPPTVKPPTFIPKVFGRGIGR